MRDPLDRYYTPRLLAEACIVWLWRHASATGPLVDPCAGGGSWLDAAEAYGWRAMGCDIDPGAPAVREGRADLSPMLEWSPPAPSVWWVTNPPYGPVEEWIQELRRRQVQRADHGVALLMRLTAVEWLMELDDRPNLLGTTSQRARWEGPGGALHGASDTCGAVLAVWMGLKRATCTTIAPIPQWRPRGRR